MPLLLLHHQPHRDRRRPSERVRPTHPANPPAAEDDGDDGARGLDDGLELACAIAEHYEGRGVLELQTAETRASSPSLPFAPPRYEPEERQRCDGARPTCSQCIHKPPKSQEPCRFAQAAGPGHQTAVQMQGTIRSLTTRVKNLEYIKGESGEIVSAASSDLRAPVQEPPVEIRGRLLTAFFDRFARGGHFFLSVERFTHATLLPLPLGHPDRPSPALLCIVYLWGALLLRSLNVPSKDTDSLNEDAFLFSALQYLPADIRGFAIQPKLVLETIQAEVLLSVYYLHASLPTQGRYHAAAAASIAMSAELHLQGVGGQPRQSYHGLNPLEYPMAEPLLPPPVDQVEATERVDAFWAMLIVNNCWVACQRDPSGFPYGMPVDTPWPGGTTIFFWFQSGSTLTRFLSGPDAYAGGAGAGDEDGSSLRFSWTTQPSPSSNLVFAHFKAVLVSVPLSLDNGDHALLLAHALTELASLRLHAALAASASSAPQQTQQARYMMLGAAARLVGLVALSARTGSDPLMAPICSTVCSIYSQELASLRTNLPTPQTRAEYVDIEARFRSLMEFMDGMARTSPVMQHCIDTVRVATLCPAK
ncbi:hypothetical protein HMN09_00989400 [Mycena chlorophos]|uniref:Transcription factor domain-containing protein n=1 Tax=Mycena chlorophos TaxID=658473 RepID=A0A8H6SJ69_MYCCL|nr:hypothetical protein HMN09_00989400 [Mycena chlorophos]